MARRPRAREPVPPEDLPKPRLVTPEPWWVRGAWFDEAAVAHYVSFLRMLRHVKTARWAGLPLELEPWQWWYFARPVFGWKYPDGRRIIRTVWWECTRKQGKSTLGAGTGLYLANADREPGAEVYAAAGAKKQARFVFDPARLMAKAAAPALRKRLSVLADVITNTKTGSKFEVLSGEAPDMYGANVHGGIIDEVWLHDSRDTVEAIETGTGARDQPLICFFTTADEDKRESIYDEKRHYVEQLAEGTLKDESFYGVVWAAEEDDDPFAEETQRKANPGYGITVTAEYLERKAREAKASPAALSSYKRLHLGIRQQAKTAWLGVDLWDLAGGEHNLVDEAKLQDHTAFGGLDLATVFDLAALNWTFPEDEGDEVKALWRFWLPAGRVADLAKRTAGNSDVWIREGFIRVTDGEVISYAAIRQQIEDDVEAFGVPREGGLAYDRFGGTQLVQELQERIGEDFPVPLGQDYATQGPLITEWERLIRLQLYLHGGNPVMRWMFGNIAVETDHLTRRRLSKKKARDNIDGASAALMGLDGVIRHRGGEESEAGVFQSM